jgi:hypothetical protein
MISVHQPYVITFRDSMQQVAKLCYRPLVPRFVLAEMLVRRSAAAEQPREWLGAAET